MQRIAVFGGTGMTGECVVDYAVEKGLKVRLLYRNEATVPERFFNKDSIELVKGDVLNLDDCVKTLNGVEGACVVLGTRHNLEPTKCMSEGTANIIQALKQSNLRVFSIIMSSFLFRKDEDVPALFANIHEEHKRMLELTKNSGLDFIAILPPHIANEPSSEIVVKENEAVGRVISKFDLAKVIVDSLDKKDYYGKIWGLSKVTQ